jgi:glycosyltransferase involved in cell wall biosynthesis
LGVAFSSGGALRRLAILMYRIAFINVPAVFVQNRDDMKVLSEEVHLRRNKLILVPGSGVDLQHFRYTPYLGPSREETVTFIGRMLWQKGVGEFVKAARIVRQERPEVRFLLLGSVIGTSRECVTHNDINGWVDEGIVSYAGQAADVRPSISRSTCVVLPSYYPEGTPRVLLEAAAMGRPIITTDTPGCRDTLDDGVTGFLCKPRDANDLAEKIMTLLAMPREAQMEMGKRGRTRIKYSYSESVVVDKYIEWIERLSDP